MKWRKLFDPPTLEEVAQFERDSAPPAAHGVARKDSSPQSADALLRRLEWTTLKRLDGLLHGDFRTLMRGSGLDLADLREYQTHDDVRHIDWNVTARMQTPYVRQFTEDRDINVWLLVDLSPSADFGSGARNKRELTIELSTILARLFTQRGNRVGAMLYTRSVDTVLPPRADRRHVLTLIQKMQRPPLHAVSHKDVSHGTNLAQLLSRAAQTIKRRSALIVVSDFISEPGWEDWLHRLSVRHDVLPVHIDDPLERELPQVGLMTIEDPETGEQLFVDTGNAALRRRFAEMASARELALKASFERAGCEPLRLATNGSLIDSLVRFVERRKLKRRGGIHSIQRRVA